MHIIYIPDRTTDSETDIGILVHGQLEVGLYVPKHRLSLQLSLNPEARTLLQLLSVLHEPACSNPKP